MIVSKKSVAMFVTIVAGISLFNPMASANMKELKAYKEAFPGSQAKCATCHAVTMPKKGAAELNAYGKAAVAASATPTAETFKSVGKAEDFKK